MNNTDVIKKLIGKVTPYGASAIDAERFENLKEMCHVADQLVDEILSVSRERNAHQSSVSIMGQYAHKFLSDLQTALKENL